jgi:outer membrane usher protein
MIGCTPWIGWLLLALPITARAAAGPVALNLSHRDLLLEVWINGSNRHEVVAVAQREGALWVARTTLVALGVRLQAPDGSGAPAPQLDLATVAGVRAQIDESGQRLLLEVDPAQLAPQLIDLSHRQPPSWQATSGTGMLLDYDLSATRDTHAAGIDGGATYAASWFSPHWRFTDSGFVRTLGERTESVRLDSALIVDRPGQLRQWVIGDSVSGGLSWSRPVRFGGLHLGSDYSLQPQMRTFPLPDFAGSVTVPSSVDVYINQTRVLSQDLSKGPFEIHDLPLVTGRGEAQVVVRDLLGREQVQSIPFYASSMLLRPGLDDYSLDLGAMRRDYVSRSFSYGKPMVSATLRHGVDDNLTAQAHGELAPGLSLAGAGVVVGVQPFGVVSVDAASSRGLGGSGHLLSIGSTSQFGVWNLFGEWLVASAGYRDAGSLYDAEPVRHRLQLGAGMTLSRRDSVAFSWTDVRYPNLHAELLGGSYTRSSSSGIYLGASLLFDQLARAWQGQVFVSVPWGRSQSASVSTGSDNGRATARASLIQSANPDGGFGYRLSGGHDPIPFAEVDATWVGSHAVVDGELSQVDGDHAVRLGARGSLAWMRGVDEVFAARSVDDAFALVRTGHPHASVYRENRKVAIADAAGVALLPSLSAYVPNRISLDPHDYPMNVMLEQVERDVVPRRGGGVLVDLKPRVTAPVLLSIRLGDGSYPPLGAQVMIDGIRTRTVVGRHGKVFVPVTHGRVSGRIVFDGRSCRFRVGRIADAERGRIPRVGPLTCHDEVRHAR